MVILLAIFGTISAVVFRRQQFARLAQAEKHHPADGLFPQRCEKRTGPDGLLPEQVLFLDGERFIESFRSGIFLLFASPLFAFVLFTSPRCF